jgi:hypothetical protein
MYKKVYHVELTLTREMLGTVPKNREIYAQYIASVAALTDEQVAEELKSVENTEERGWTGFHINEEGLPFVFDYLIKGYLKETCGHLRRGTSNLSKSLTAYKKVINGCVWPSPRQIVLNGDIEAIDLEITPDGIEVTNNPLQVLERSLRASTAQGERVTLARSDYVPAGTKLSFDLTILASVVTEKVLREWLDYGQFGGLGQWRSAGYGAFEYTLSKVE